MIFKFLRKKQKHFNLEDVIQDVNFKQLTTKEMIDNKLVGRLGRGGVYFICSLVVAVFFVFAASAYRLQVLDYEKYLNKSNNNQFVAVPILPMRGSILDRNGEVLAKSVKDSNDANGYVREYTKRQGFGHLVGYVNYPKKDTSGVYYQDNFVGVSGLEAYYDQLLAGRVGKRFYEKDANKVTDSTYVVDQPIEGKDIKTSIDADVQEFAYKKLKDFVISRQFESGTVAIMDMQTGQLITMTNYPEYEPNRMIPSDEYSATERNDYIKQINSDKNTPLLNRAIAGTFAPGSTMKPVFALAALQLGLIDPVTSILSVGHIEVPNAVDPTKVTIFRDWKAHGWMNVRTALAESSDEFFYAVGGGYHEQKGLGIGRIDEWSKAYGVDSLTGIDLGGEVTGNIPTPEWKQKVFKEAWRLGDTYNSSIGQFGFLVTPIGLMRLTAAIGNGGTLITPKIRMDEDSKPMTRKVKENVNDEWYKVVNEGLRMVVTQGTAKNLNTPMFEIAGKSGTAEVGVDKSHIQSWIVGYFPYKKPRYAFVFLCAMGIKNKSPMPNVLAREVLEYMWVYKPELFDRASTTKAVELLDTSTTSTSDDLRSR
jgi:penicillin-binding protein 2